MRIRLSHRTSYEYETPARAVIQLLRMTPRPHDGQQVMRWHIEIDADANVRRGEDALGNITHAAFVEGPLSRLVVSVTGEVETWDTSGVLRGTVERFPPEVFLRETPLTQPDADLRRFALDSAGGPGDPLEKLHALMAAVSAEVVFDTAPTDAATPAAAAFALRRGVCQDLAHVFIAAARTLGAPARYVSGHLVRDDGAEDQEAAHAWAEAHVPGLGWVGFDAANCLCPTPSYLRVAIGLDYLGAAPVRGSRSGGGAEHMEVKLKVGHAGQQSQA